MAGHIAAPINVAKGATLGKIFTGTGVDAAAWQALNTAPDAGLTGRIAAPGAYAPEGIGVLVRSFADTGMFAPSAFSGYEYGLPVGGELVLYDNPAIVGPLTTLVPGVEMTDAALGTNSGIGLGPYLKLPVGTMADWWLYVVHTDTPGGAPVGVISRKISIVESSTVPGFTLTRVDRISGTGAGMYFVGLKSHPTGLANAHLTTSFGAWQNWYH